MTQNDIDTNGTDRVQYVTRDDELLSVVGSSMVPEKHEFVLLNDEEWQVYHISHTVEEGDHIATVFVWQPDEGWSDGDIEQTIRDTLRAQRSKERERLRNAEIITTESQLW